MFTGAKQLLRVFHTSGNTTQNTCELYCGKYAILRLCHQAEMKERADLRRQSVHLERAAQAQSHPPYGTEKSWFVTLGWTGSPKNPTKRAKPRHLHHGNISPRNKPAVTAEEGNAPFDLLIDATWRVTVLCSGSLASLLPSQVSLINTCFLAQADLWLSGANAFHLRAEQQDMMTGEWNYVGTTKWFWRMWQ